MPQPPLALGKGRVKVNLNLTVEEAVQAQRRNRVIAILFL
jgi:hypothetical protein